VMYDCVLCFPGGSELRRGMFRCAGQFFFFVNLLQMCLMKIHTGKQKKKIAEMLSKTFFENTFSHSINHACI